MSEAGKRMKNANQLNAFRESHGHLGQYHQELARWSRNVDQRYAWVVLVALWLLMVATLGPYRVYSLIFAKVTKDGDYSREEATWPVAAIFTVENVLGPFVSVIAYYISKRSSMFLGSLLLTLGNGLAGLSGSLVFDVLLIGVVQGVGYAFIFMPFMEIVNSYFVRYRNMALGIALCGGTMSVFALSPLFNWLLERYPWRQSYFAISGICAIGLLMVPFLRPNPKPERPDASPQPGGERESLRRNTFRALSYQNSIRRASTIMITRNEGASHRASVVSINPFASSVGLERKISRVVSGNRLDAKPMSRESSYAGEPEVPVDRTVARLRDAQELETVSLSEIEAANKAAADFDVSIIWEVLATPAFHFIWFSELTYYWVFSIFCLVAVDYGADRGCTDDQAEGLLSFMSAGEMLGRLVLTILVDLNFMANRNVAALVLVLVSGLLVLITQVSGFLWIASITVAVNALLSLLYILLNGLLVDYLGERRVTIGYGMASCIGGVLMSARPQAVGYFRDNLGTYDPLMWCLAGACGLSALTWLVEPALSRLCGGGTAKAPS